MKSKLKGPKNLVPQRGIVMEQKKVRLQSALKKILQWNDFSIYSYFSSYVTNSFVFKKSIWLIYYW